MNHRRCTHCGSPHHPPTYHTEKYETKDKISDKGYPQQSKKYPSAHEAADKEEKKRFPKGYKAMKKVDAKLPKHELAGKNLKSGKLEVSKRVPTHLRKEVAFHEKVESDKLRGKK